MTGQDAIFALRQRLSMSQAEFGRALSHGRYGGWYSPSYISKIEAGKVPVTDEMMAALARLDTGTSHLHILPRAIYSTSDLPSGTVILGQVTICGGCGMPFVFPWGNQRYCSNSCRNEARRRRRQEAQCATT